MYATQTEISHFDERALKAVRELLNFDWEKEIVLKHTHTPKSEMALFRIISRRTMVSNPLMCAHFAKMQNGILKNSGTSTLSLSII